MAQLQDHPLGTVFTVGHSNRPLAEFLGLLTAHGVDVVVDVRKMPRSRANPQFNADTLESELAGAGVGYVQIPQLAGLRKKAKDHGSENAGWRSASFRAYADYMQTPEFADGLGMLLAIADEHRVAVMCAEAVWWRCHRQLIADALVARGVPVRHVTSATRAEAHALRPMAHVEGTKVTYPASAAAPAESESAAPPRVTRGTPRRTAAKKKKGGAEARPS